jgi:hypothetical protein
MKALDEPQSAGADVRLTEVVRLEGQSATVALRVQVVEKRSVAPVLVGQSRVVFEEEPLLRCEGGGGGKGKTKVYRPKKVVRIKVDALLIYGWKCSCLVRLKHRSGARRSWRK